ncbi:cobyrinate a,c-diamide synthase [Oscillospiraceae bacterium CM]|nr:cobyrinate a,c-diamide synthase [Oscillospiraceae bacterium CM]
MPRILIAAPASGTGKTTVTLALLSALRKRGANPVSFKCGPDYIDPMFHRAVLGIPSYNLDLFFTPEDVVRGLLCQHAAGHTAVIEGVMGYYDGSGNTTAASSYAVAAVTETPVILVVSAHGAYLSLAATINGFKNFRPDSRIAGVILNECSKSLFDMVKDLLTAETGLPILGYFERLPDCAIESRHLGLVTAAEIENLHLKLDRLGEAAEKCVDLDALLALASSAPPLQGSLPGVLPALAKKPRIAVAQDDAFCFYYADNLDLLTHFGAELVPFSPLRDAALPKDIGALYLGGGYPELYADVLSENTSMRRAIFDAVSSGLPTLAECGGYLYLHDTLEDSAGKTYPMAGVLSGHGFKTPRLQRFGYIRLTADCDTILCKTGETIPAHEFHYWDSTITDGMCTARRTNGSTWSCVAKHPTLFAGFPHLYFYGNPAFAENFVQAAAAYSEARL